MLAKIFDPPYYAVVFASEKMEASPEQDAYDIMASQMLDLAAKQPGYLGVETVENELGQGITVSYWENLEAIKAWREHTDHQAAQKLGRDVWYKGYTLRVAKVEKAYDFARD